MGSSLSFFTFMYLSFLLFSFQITSSRQPLCHDKEHSALLRFKESLFIDHEYFLACSAKTELWNPEGNGDCCSWDGVKCSEDTGYVIKLDLSSSCLSGSINSASTLFHLVHLQWLSLAYNNFTDSKIPSGIMNLSRLSHLNLSHSYFSGQIPPEMLELSNLESLDLSGYWSFDLLRYELQLQKPGYGLQLQQPDLKSLVEKLTNLKVLDLSNVNNISSSQLEVLTNLSSLKFLSLQNCNLEGTIPSSLGNLYNLIHLDLSDNNFLGQIPSEMLEFSQLEYLDLSYNWDSSLEKTLQLRQPGGLRSLVDKLTNLKWLDLTYVNISSSIPTSLGNLSSLAHLSLSECNLQGQIPSEMLELSQLEYLDLSYNWDSSLEKTLQLQQPGGLRSLVDKLTNLKWLDLNYVNISSSIPTSLGNLSSLTHLSLYECNLQGEIPSEMFELSQLEYLDLSWNSDLQLRQPASFDKLTNLKWLDLNRVNISSSIPNSLGNLSSLTHLSLYGCNLQGTIPSSIGSLTKLLHLDISSNNFRGELSVQTLSSVLGNLTQLNSLDLSYNDFSSGNSSSWSWIAKHTKLTQLYLSGVNLAGEIPIWLMNLTHLSSLYMRSNKLSGPIPFWFMKLNHLSSLGLSSNQLQVPIPSSFFELNNLQYLDLSSNNLSGQIPGWLFNLSIGSLQNLNLSHNLLTGFDQQPDVLPWTSLRYLDLRFNRLQGPLPIPPMSTSHYLVSNNKLSGEIRSWMCKLNSLYALDLSNNNLSGKLPKCLGNFSYGLSMLDLQNNKFYGSIPLNFINGTELKMIDLSNNMLRGKIPRSLVNCTMLEYLDLGNNKINDTFPSWIGSLPKLEVLNLKSNKLHGVIDEPNSDFVFPKLRLLDLSHNRFIGKFPSKYFQCWNAMKFDNESGLTYMMKDGSVADWYDYSLIVVNKGIEIEYVKIPNMLTGIWLSSNGFEGEFPNTISVLKGLRYLDLSNNNLTGGIPSSLDNLTVLESLVLSNNKLSGEIPQQLVKLTFLEFFNVSYNHLEGPIPQGSQFNTFDNTSYEGNSGLCGQPLSRICGNPMLPRKEDDEGLKSPFAFGWKVVAIGYACGLIVGVFLGYIFCTRKHEWFVKIFGMPLKRMERKRGRPRN